MNAKRFVLPAVLIALSVAVSPAARAVVLSGCTNVTYYIGSDYEGDDVTVIGPSCRLLIDGAVSYNSLTLQGGAVVAHSAAGLGTTNHWIDLTVTGDVSIDAASRIDGAGLGYSSTQGPGAGEAGNCCGGGASHAGFGGTSWSGAGTGSAYGSILQPADWGSGGGAGNSGAGGAGGGRIHLVVGGTLTVDGLIRADGADGVNNNAGGGAGGSVWLDVGTLAGSGAITADGGVGENGNDGGGGGGGRIALYYDANSFAGAVSAHGEGTAGKARGGAGTVYTRANADSVGALLMDNGAGAGGLTPFTAPEIFDVRVRSHAIAYPDEAITLLSLVVETNGTCTQVNGQTGLVANVTGDIDIQPGGFITVDAKGYPIGMDAGPGAGGHTGDTGGGGGYGGMGGAGEEGSPAAPGGDAYGSILQPLDLGSAGARGDAGPELAPGGGMVRLIVGGTLTVDGSLSANGANYWKNDQGGGSGGSIWITVGTLTGTGTISADGGAGETHGGGGGGGRIAGYYDADTFTGTVSARGAAGWNQGGAGTLYSKSSLENVGSLFVDNGGASGALTPLTSPEAFDLTIGSGTWAYPALPMVVTNLQVDSGGHLIHLTGQSNIHLTVQQDVLIESGGEIAADAKGYPVASDPGPGAGVHTGDTGGGGGYGGMGGEGLNGSPDSAGGGVYGSILEPVDLGSAGARGDAGPAQTAGGGAIRLIVGGTLTVDGRLTAEGQDDWLNDQGGGSGGSLWLTVDTLAGSGVISANGGTGETHGGGGAGGRIAIYYDINVFSGALTARGSAGWVPGGAGTVYARATGDPAGALLVENGAVTGALTPLTSPVAFDLEVGEGAILLPTASLTVRGMQVTTNATVLHLAGQSNIHLVVQNDLVVDQGGEIQADGKGYPLGTDGGPGEGVVEVYSSGGGSHGGLGGASYRGASGGPVYDSVLTPTQWGSAGGPRSGEWARGGGVIRLEIGGTFTVNGRVSANGNPGTVNNAGGGAGGSIWLDVAELSGTGVIAANGGAGERNIDGGGGGGGRIAVYYATNGFAGAVTTWGGGNTPARGGAGTIYTRDIALPAGELLVDNGGVTGAHTPLSSPEPFALTVSGEAIVYPDPSLLVGDLLLSSDGTLVHLPEQAQLDLTVLNNAVIETGAVVQVSGQGHGPALGPGAGGDHGATCCAGGAGYGGVGGMSATGIPGGPEYGSLEEPVDKGSGGGDGNGGPGGKGGGAIRLSVGGTLTLDGLLAADGTAGTLNNSGGGSGGSIYLTVGTLEGGGAMSAAGGRGESFDGGGGAGGRVAIYAQDMTAFTNVTGRVDIDGGIGAQTGGTGTLYLASANLPLEVVLQSPDGTMKEPVSEVDFFFSTPIDPASVGSDDVVLTAPGGPVPPAQVDATLIGGTTLRMSFPPQTDLGLYQVEVGPTLQSLFGEVMAAPYMGAFTIAQPVISGTITVTNGLPAVGVVLSIDSGPATAVTDTNGTYALAVDPGWSGVVTPSNPGWDFGPGSRTYTVLSADIAGQDYTMADTLAASLNVSLQGNDLAVTWYGVNGVLYQPYSSTNMNSEAWSPYNGTVAGTNGVEELLVPLSGEPEFYLRIEAEN